MMMLMSSLITILYITSVGRASHGNQERHRMIDSDTYTQPEFGPAPNLTRVQVDSTAFLHCNVLHLEEDNQASFVRLDRCLQTHIYVDLKMMYLPWKLLLQEYKLNVLHEPLLAQMLVAVVYQLSCCTHSVTHCCKLLTLLPNVTNKVLPNPTCNTLKVYFPTHMLNKQKKTLQYWTYGNLGFFQMHEKLKIV